MDKDIYQLAMEQARDKVDKMWEGWDEPSFNPYHAFPYVHAAEVLRLQRERLGDLCHRRWLNGRNNV